MSDSTSQPDEGGTTLHPGCPVLTGFDPIDPAQLADPSEWTARAREEQPVFYMPKYGLWCLTRYDDILEVFGDPVTYSNEAAHDLQVPMPADIEAEVGRDYFPLRGMVVVTDPPTHTRLRKLMQPGFTPKRVAGYEDRVRGFADEIIDGALDVGEMDLLSEFAIPIPSRVIATVLGIDPYLPEVSRKFQKWISSAFQLEFANDDMTTEEARSHWSNVLEWDRFVTAYVERNREDPGDNILTDWMNARTDEGEPKMSDAEVLSNALGLMGAGSDTTANVIAQTMFRLLREPDLWRRVVDEPSLIPNAIEETIRFMGPVRGQVRTTTREVEFRGVNIPAGLEDLPELHRGELRRGPLRRSGRLRHHAAER